MVEGLVESYVGRGGDVAGCQVQQQGMFSLV